MARASALLGVARRRRDRRASNSARGAEQQRSASCSGSASTSRSLRAIVVRLAHAGLVERACSPRRASPCVLASTSPNLPNSVLTAPSTRHTSLDALLDRQRAKAHLQAVEQRQRGWSGRRASTRYSRCSASARPGRAQHLGVQAFGRQEQDREVGGVRRRDVLVADRPAPRRAGASRAPRRAASAAGASARSMRVLQALVVVERELGVDRQPARRAVVAAAGQADRELDALVAARASSRRWSRTAAASAPARAARRAAPRPSMPRVLTLVSTRFRSPTPAASVCISPRPLCTCSSRSDTCLNDSPRRCSSVACSFSSTVARICSSLAALSVRSASRRCSTVVRTASERAARWLQLRRPRGSLSPAAVRCTGKVLADVALARARSAVTPCFDARVRGPALSRSRFATSCDRVEARAQSRRVAHARASRSARAIAHEHGTSATSRDDERSDRQDDEQHELDVMRESSRRAQSTAVSASVAKVASQCSPT